MKFPMNDRIFQRNHIQSEARFVQNGVQVNVIVSNNQRGGIFTVADERGVTEVNLFGDPSLTHTPRNGQPQILAYDPQSMALLRAAVLSSAQNGRLSNDEVSAMSRHLNDAIRNAPSHGVGVPFESIRGVETATQFLHDRDGRLSVSLSPNGEVSVALFSLDSFNATRVLEQNGSRLSAHVAGNSLVRSSDEAIGFDRAAGRELAEKARQAARDGVLDNREVRELGQLAAQTFQSTDRGGVIAKPSIENQTI